MSACEYCYNDPCDCDTALHEAVKAALLAAPAEDWEALTYGGLFEGYGGLTMGVQSVLGGDLSWYSEFDKAPSKILAHHHPGVPNLGDMTKVDWSQVEPVDVLTGGTPCQDLSHAGKRAGMTEGTRSNLWVQMREAIAHLRPSLVVWENVRGAYSAEADSALEHCAGCMGDPRDRGPVLRALGRVLGDLSDLGYDAWWYGLRAADVGAAHGRFRIFVFATPADSDLSGLQERGDQGSVRAAQVGTPAAVDGDRGEPAHVPGQLTLLPTPAVNDMGAAYTPETWDAWTDRMKAEHGNGNGHGKSLNIEALRLLPTPKATNNENRSSDWANGPNIGEAIRALPEQDWREYEAAIRRQEHAFGRLAPLPTEPGAKGQPRLSPKFVEWLMAVPEGHVTDPAIGISRNDQLKALGNGVVPPQAAAATRAWLADRARQENVA